jgi:formylglycine-generating enzyme required for sulfatase activity
MEYLMSNARLRLVWIFGAALLLSVTQLPGKPFKEAKDPAPDQQDQKVVTNSIGMKLVRIPPGKFVMGSPKEEKERFANEDQHEVEITKAFFMGKYTVTQSEYVRVMDKNPSHFKEVARVDTSRFPVESVSWNDAVAFCAELSKLPGEKAAGRKYRLPTDAEWEYACRAGTTTPFHYGAALSSQQANVFGGAPYGGGDVGPTLSRPTTVGSYPPNAFGLHDMHGNVWQWVKDCHVDNPPAGKDPEVAEGTARVVRGGSWLNPPSSARAAQRHTRSEPQVSGNYLGFRVVATSN